MRCNTLAISFCHIIGKEPARGKFAGGAEGGGGQFLARTCARMGGRGSRRAVAEPARVQTDRHMHTSTAEASAASATNRNEVGGRGSCHPVAEPARVQTDRHVQPSTSEASAVSATNKNEVGGPRSNLLPLTARVAACRSSVGVWRSASWLIPFVDHFGPTTGNRRFKELAVK